MSKKNNSAATFKRTDGLKNPSIQTPHLLALQRPIGCVPLDDLTDPNWKMQLADFLGRYGRSRSNDFKLKCSETTFIDRRQILFSAIGDIIKDKKLRSLSLVKPRHLPRMFELWDARGVSKRTQINNYNVMRYFWRVCGIQIPPIRNYEKTPGEFTIERNATLDKSWAGNGVDFWEIHKKISEYDPVAGRLMLAMKTYGLRLKESLCLRPHESDGVDRLNLTRGTKTGRERQLVFAEFGDAAFRNVLDELKAEVTPEQHLAWSNRSLKQAKTRLKTIAQKFGLTKRELGVTWHGLRTEFAIDKFTEQTGLDAPVRNGLVINYKDLSISAARAKVSKALGHNRREITGAYYGSFMSKDRAQLRTFQQNWVRIETVMHHVAEILHSHGIENLYWIGSRANGNAKSGDPYQFLLAPGADAELSLTVCSFISETVEATTGVETVVRPWAGLSSNQRVLQESEAIPLFKAISPMECMRQRVLESRHARTKEGQVQLAKAIDVAAGEKRGDE